MTNLNFFFNKNNGYYIFLNTGRDLDQTVSIKIQNNIIETEIADKFESIYHSQ